MRPPTLERRYLDLLKNCLTRSLFPEAYDRIPPNNKTLWRLLRWRAYDLVNRALAPAKMALVHSGRATGETMLGPERLDNIEYCIVEALKAGVPGDVLEAGVWRGGATIYMRAVLDLFGGKERLVWAADSFAGLPPPNAERYPVDAGSTFWKQTLDVSVEEVKRNFERYGFLDERVKFLIGFFSDTMPTAPVDKLAVLRLDGDMYESTYVVLEHLYPKVSPGGFVIVDDYGCVPACARATEDYRREHGITAPVHKIDWTGVFWQKTISEYAETQMILKVATSS